MGASGGIATGGRQEGRDKVLVDPDEEEKGSDKDFFEHVHSFSFRLVYGEGSAFFSVFKLNAFGGKGVPYFI